MRTQGQSERWPGDRAGCKRDDRAAYRDYYDEETKARVAQHFGADIEAFGCEF